MIETAESLCVRVYRRSGLKEIAEATLQCDTVILFAHWRGYSVETSELETYFEAVASRLQKNSGHPVGRVLGPIPRTAFDLAIRLNSIIMDGQLLQFFPSDIAEAGKSSPILGRTLSRDLIDELLEGTLPPGNRVELYDGLHTLAEFERSIYQGFEGELEIAMCYSKILATFLDMRRRGKIRHLHWPDLVLPLAAIRLSSRILKIYGG